MIDSVPVDVRYNISEKEFQEEFELKRKPCVFKGMDIGPCMRKWSVNYLCEKGGSKMATVHVSDTPQMNFITKNFLYRQLPFSDVVQRASELTHSEYFSAPDEYYYFRSLGEDVRKDPSNIMEQFPEFKEDIKWPHYFPEDKFFSSVFRIASAGMQLWTHYDVMDNFLIQVNGRKKAVLFPPSDALNLYLKGDKSEVTDVDSINLDKYPNFANVTKYQCMLEPGDILYIPALWFHNVVAVEFGVAVNVFWKNLDKKYYDQKDPYGNKDLLPAARSMDILNRALKVLSELPDTYKDFYARKMVSKIESSAFVKND
ncbi:tRNA wybutosine-synthesizing protein 5-like [Clavelina lepadiformis]